MYLCIFVHIENLDDISKTLTGEQVSLLNFKIFYSQRTEGGCNLYNFISHHYMCFLSKLFPIGTNYQQKELTLEWGIPRQHIPYFMIIKQRNYLLIQILYTLNFG